MRYLLFTLLGFFGPALLMLLLRLIWMRIRYAITQKKAEPEIIDVTPKKSGIHVWFIIAWLIISITCTAFLIWKIDDTPASQQTYIPAHINAEGTFVPATTLDESRSDK
ncbi:MAG: hypothetical protein R8M46_03555 [Ghiorsea sp.]